MKNQKLRRYAAFALLGWLLLAAYQRIGRRIVQPYTLEVSGWVIDAQNFQRGNPRKMAAYTANLGVTTQITKTNDTHRSGGDWHPSCSKELFERIVAEGHKLGIREYGYGFFYGLEKDIEIAIACEVLDIADGYVFNVEEQVGDNPSRWATMQQVCAAVASYRDQYHPGKPLFLSTFAPRREMKKMGGHFPYWVFQDLDGIWFQNYWFDAKTGKKKWTPDFAVTEVDTIWQEKLTSFASEYELSAKGRAFLRNYVHTGRTLNIDSKIVPASELKTFLTTLHAEGHSRADVYRIDGLTKSHEAVIQEFTGVGHPISNWLIWMLLIAALLVYLFKSGLYKRIPHQKLGKLNYRKLIILGVALLALYWIYQRGKQPLRPSLTPIQVANTPEWLEQEKALQRLAVADERERKAQLIANNAFYENWSGIQKALDSGDLTSIESTPDCGISIAPDMGKLSPDHQALYHSLDPRLWEIVKSIGKEWKAQGGQEIVVNSAVRSNSYEGRAGIKTRPTYHTSGKAVYLVLEHASSFNRWQNGPSFADFLRRKGQKDGFDFYTEKPSRNHIHLFLKD